MSEKRDHKLSHRDRRGFLVGMAVALLVVVIVVVKWVGYHHRHRPIEPGPPIPVDVGIVDLERGAQPICVTVFGTAQSEKVVELIAPFRGKIVESSNPFVGQFIPADELIYLMDLRPVDLQISKYRAQIRQLEVDQKQLCLQERLLEGQVETTGRLVELAEATFKTRQADYVIQEQLLAANTSLFESGDISYFGYLTSQERINASQISLIKADEQVQSMQNSLDGLRENLVKVRADRINIPNRIDESTAAIQQQLIERSKGRISVPFAAGVVDVAGHVDMEVQPGMRLAVVQSAQSIEVPVNIPDNYLKWVYNSPCFLQASLAPSTLPKVEVRLVNQNFKKLFTGAYVKAISQNLNVPTRSLPVVVGRENPLDEAGLLLPNEELKPGMYCEVTFYLDTVSETFLIPIHALQVQNRIYYAEPLPDDSPLRSQVECDGDGSLATLGIIYDVEIVHQSEKGVVVRLPERFESLTVIAHQMNRAQPGMLLCTHDSHRAIEEIESILGDERSE